MGISIALIIHSVDRSLSASLIVIHSLDLFWSERLEAKWLHKDLLDLSIQQERPGAVVIVKM